MTKTICTCSPVKGLPGAKNIDPECPQHGYGTAGALPHQSTGCTCPRTGGLPTLPADIDCPTHGDQCPLHHDSCPRDCDCSWWEARCSGVPWFGSMGCKCMSASHEDPQCPQHGEQADHPRRRAVPRVMPGLDGIWTVQGPDSYRMSPANPVSESYAPPEEAERQASAPVDTADVAAVLRNLAWLYQVYADESDRRSRTAPTDHHIESQSRAAQIGRALAYENAATLARRRADEIEGIDS